MGKPCLFGAKTNHFPLKKVVFIGQFSPRFSVLTNQRCRRIRVPKTVFDIPKWNFKR